MVMRFVYLWDSLRGEGLVGLGWLSRLHSDDMEILAKVFKYKATVGRVHQLLSVLHHYQHCRLHAIRLLPSLYKVPICVYLFCAVLLLMRATALRSTHRECFI